MKTKHPNKKANDAFLFWCPHQPTVLHKEEMFRRIATDTLTWPLTTYWCPPGIAFSRSQRAQLLSGFLSHLSISGCYLLIVLQLPISLSNSLHPCLTSHLSSLCQINLPGCHRAKNHPILVIFKRDFQIQFWGRHFCRPSSFYFTPAERRHQDVSNVNPEVQGAPSTRGHRCSEMTQPLLPKYSCFTIRVFTPTPPCACRAIRRTCKNISRSSIKFQTCSSLGFFSP